MRIWLSIKSVEYGDSADKMRLEWGNGEAVVGAKKR